MSAVSKKIYIDLKYGFDRLSNGDFSPVYDANSINQSLMTLLNTKIGERFFNPTYGTNIFAYLFEPFDSLTASNIQNELETAINFWEGTRIKITDINILMNFDTLTYKVTIIYKIKSTPIIGNLTLSLQKS